MSLDWNENYNTGIWELDNQHKTFFTFIHELRRQIREDSGNITVGQALKFLRIYTDFHFQKEEQCMAHKNCPASFENEQAHGDFLKFLSSFEARYQAEGHNKILLKQIHGTVDSWMTNHICSIDVQLKNCK